MNFPFIATLVLLFGLFGLVLSLFLSAWRYHARVATQTDPNLPPNLQEDFGPRLTSQRLRWVRWAFALTVLAALGFHFYWGLFSTGPLGADADFAGLKARRDQRNRRENESTLRGWIFDRHKDTRRALAKYRYLNGEIKRDYPLGDAASHIVGFATLVRGDDGLERAVAAPPPPKEEKSWWQKLTDFSSEPPRPPVGQDLALTIDFDLQRAAADQLQNKRGAVVMLNPQTGEILAMVSTPGFDPDDVNNDPTWAKLQTDVARKPMLNRAINEYYLPGSTLKTITAAAAIDARLDDKVFTCRGEGWTPPGSGRPIRDDEGESHGSIGLLEAYTHSCNQYFAQLGVEVERQRMGEAAARFGLKVFDSGIDSLRAGFAPNFWNTENPVLAGVMSPRYSTFVAGKGVTKYDLGLESIGQGYVQLTPLQMAMVAGAVATGILAALVARPIFKLKGNYLAMATLGLGIIINITLRNEAQWTGGPDGMPVPAMGAFDRTRWRTSGPMITAPRGYPTLGWGADGYGLEASGAASVRAAIDGLADAGAGLIKVPFGHGPELREAELAALVEHAHARGLKVAAHALLDADVARAAAAGIDVLAHTPLEPLSDATVRALANGRPRAVVSTLMAFGGSRVAVDNLRRLHEAGVVVLYGTDLGNSPVLGIDVDELALLRHAGLSPQQGLDAATTTAAAWWGLSELGALAPGRAATFLVLDDDPLEHLDVLARPSAVWIDGVPQAPAGE